MEEITKLHCVLLKGEENFGVWKFQIQTILDGMDVFEVVNGSVRKPTDSEARDYEPALSSYMKKEKKARQIIATTIHPNLVKHIMYCKSSLEMWNKFHEIFQQKSQMSRHMLLKSFFNYSKEPQDSIADHISKLVDMSERLGVLGEKISKTMLMTKILMSLPSVYNHFHSAWDSVDAEEQTIENLRTRLMTEESRIALENFGFEDGNAIAMIAKYPKEDKSKICNYCKQAGHWKKDCEKLKAKMEQQECNLAF